MLVVMRGDRKEVRSSEVAARRWGWGSDAGVMRKGDVQEKGLEGGRGPGRRRRVHLPRWRWGSAPRLRPGGGGREAPAAAAASEETAAVRARRSPPAAAWTSRQTDLGLRASQAPTARFGTRRAPRGGGGGGAARARGRGGESACPHPPPASLGPPPSRDSTSLHLLSAAPVASASPAYPRSGVRCPIAYHLHPTPNPGPALRPPATLRAPLQALLLGPCSYLGARSRSPALPGPQGPRPGRCSPFSLPVLQLPLPLSFFPRNPGPASRGLSPPFSLPANPTPVSPSPGRRRPRKRGAGREGGGAGDRGSSRAEGGRRVQGKTGRGEGRGRPGEGASHNPSPGSRPGSRPLPRPPTAREGVEVGWRGQGVLTHTGGRGLNAAERSTG